MRSRNGYIDDGTPIRQSVGELCPNCKSDQYVETVSREHCPACGLECDYWGGGSNEVYDEMMREQWRREEEEREKRLRDDLDSGPDYFDIFI